MKRLRIASLTLLTAGICLSVLWVLVWGRPKSAAEVALVPRGIQTNSAGVLCMLVAVTNRSSVAYGVGFAAQAKVAGIWVDPSLIKHFDACSGEQLPPGGEIEVLVPVPQTSGPWRVAAAYYDKQMPGNWIERYCRAMRMRLSRGHGLRFVTSLDLHLNQKVQIVLGTNVVAEPIIRAEITDGKIVLNCPADEIKKITEPFPKK
jgi:hypothetical protein